MSPRHEGLLSAYGELVLIREEKEKSGKVASKFLKLKIFEGEIEKRWNAQALTVSKDSIRIQGIRFIKTTNEVVEIFH